MVLQTKVPHRHECYYINIFIIKLLYLPDRQDMRQKAVFVLYAHCSLTLSNEHYYVRGSITARLTSCFTGLISEALLYFNYQQIKIMQTSKTGVQI